MLERMSTSNSTIGANDYAVLISVSEAEEDGLGSVADISDKLRSRGHNLSRRHLSKKLNRLVGQGYLEVERINHYLSYSNKFSVSLRGHAVMTTYVASCTDAPDTAGTAKVTVTPSTPSHTVVFESFSCDKPDPEALVRANPDRTRPASPSSWWDNYKTQQPPARTNYSSKGVTTYYNGSYTKPDNKGKTSKPLYFKVSTSNPYGVELDSSADVGVVKTAKTPDVVTM